jgi:hypothetical protein
MKVLFMAATILMAFMLVSCNKETAFSTVPTALSLKPTTALTLLQNSWISSESVEIPYYGDSSWGWFGNGVFPYSISFSQTGIAVIYNSIDLSDDQWYDTCAYRLLADDSTLLFYQISDGVQTGSADTAKIRVINDSALVLYYIDAKAPTVADSFHK